MSHTESGKINTNGGTSKDKLPVKSDVTLGHTQDMLIFAHTFNI